MRYLLIIVVVLALLVGGAALWASRFPEIEAITAPTADAFDSEMVERGEALSALGACAVCHTRPGGEAYAGGLALETPFGAVYASNITPDPETGIGSWSLEAFRRAMHQGVDRRGRHLFPAFPYDHFTRVTDEDVEAIYAFLMTREPVVYEAPPPELEFPFDQRILLAGWNLLYLDEGRYRPDPERTDAWNRGGYLAEGLGHCGACHTPRNAFGAVENVRKFDGATVEGWHAPALNENSPAPAPWTADALVNYLLDGWDRNHGIAEGPMTPVVDELGTASEEDAYAIAEYALSFQPQAGDEERASVAEAFAEARAFGSAETPRDGPEFDAEAQPALATGARVFAERCANCHRAGTQTAPLALTSSVNGPDPRNAIYAIEEGVVPPANSFDKSMPAVGRSLTDEDLINLLVFMREHFADKPAWDDVAVQVRAIRGG